ncbi:hypothetical protein D0962_23345 [Leptolyngbyaceae cyanobacterium CCMR0082]|uniref:Uncharacterized protein n=1 Tax=Adonisia turfae CCMR0082 TaxID=2304604 RepID=A0A6M0SAX6_9CYAN|nr:hypothetical protein [Adonisia turfae]NEZ65655.1 hypothetical protein [Adonisia turfae CCMR0082]
MLSSLFPSLSGVPGLLSKASTEPDLPPNETILNGLVGWWEFAEDSNQLDRQSEVLPNIVLFRIDNPNSKTDSILGDFSVGQFTPDKALYHDQSGGFIDVLEFPGDIFYIAIWVKDFDAAFGYIAGIYNTGSDRRVWAMRKYSGGRVSLDVSSDGTSGGISQVFTENLPLESPVWTLIEGYFNQGQLGIAVNGAATFTKNTASSPSLYRGANADGNNTAFMLGASDRGGLRVNSPSNIFVDQLVLMNRVPTTAERGLIWNNGNGQTLAQISGIV